MDQDFRTQVVTTMCTKQTASLVAAFVIALMPAQPLNAQAPSVLKDPNIEIKYQAPTKSKFIPQDKLLEDAKKWLEERQVLERFGQLITPLRLPQKLLLTARTCDEPNAYYNHKEVSIIICYEFIPNIRLLALKQQVMGPKHAKNKDFIKGAGIAKDDVEVGGLAFAMLHEVGHMVFHLFEIPVFGRNEDAADQVAAFLSLKFSPPLTQRLIKGGAAFLYGDAADSQTLAQFADEHGSPTQRFMNVFCIAYGSNPQAYQYIVGPQLLPKERAAGCAEEYKQVERAFTKTIEPHLDKARVEALKARKSSLAFGFK